MNKLRNFIYLLLFFSSTLVFAVDGPPKKIIDFQANFENSKVESQQILQLEIDLDVIPAHYLYHDKLKIVWPKDFKVKNTKLQVSPTKIIRDKFSKKDKSIVEKKAKILTTVELPKFSKQGKMEIPIGLRYQACSAKYCLLPKTEFRKIEFQVIGGLTAPVKTQSLADKESFSFEKALEKGWLFTFLFVFLAGVLTSFTPCVFPMIPITLAVIGSRSKESTKLQSFFLSLSYVLGIAITYSVLGLFAAKTGALFGSFMSNPIVVGVIAGVLITMALSMFGLFEIKTPNFLANRVSKSGESKGLGGAFLAGLIAGVVASPCVGPVLVGILTFVAKSQSATLGFWLLFTFAIGLGMIFLVLGTFSQLIQYLPRSGHWMNVTKFIFGVSMLALAVYFASPLMPREYVLLSIGITTVALGLVLGFLRTSDTNNKALRRALGSISIVVGASLIFYAGTQFSDTPQVKKGNLHAWSAYSEKKVNEYLALGKPVIIDFKADWCAACLELENKTFSTKLFQDESTRFGLLYVDATDVTPEVGEIIEKFGVLGLPTIIFIGKDGKVKPSLSLTGFEPAEDFIKRMKALN